MHEAYFYIKHEDGSIQCELCPHNCKLKEGQWGICNVRMRKGDKIFDEGYGRISSLALDPVEKKPLYHFYPGAQILSVGGLGCNFNCNFCQNHTISQIKHEVLAGAEVYSPEEIVNAVLSREPLAGIAFTYNEPMINFDFMLDTATLAKTYNIPTAVVSNGYVNSKPLKDLIEVTDAFNIDLKGFSDRFYKKFAGGRLQPVIDALEQIAASGRLLEVTHLVVTDANDDMQEFAQMIDWIHKHLGPDTPFHISRYYPHFNYNQPATEVSLIDDFVKKAKEKLNFVYPGNIHTDASTYCPQCGARIIKRSGYSTHAPGLSQNRCLKCKYELPIII